jgi:hypothetical protein
LSGAKGSRINSANHLAESALFSIALHCIAARCLPEHALSVAEGGSMTMKVRCGALPQCRAARCLPEHALSFAKGVSMTSIFVAVCRGMQRPLCSNRL